MFFGHVLDCLERQQVAGPVFFGWDDVLKSIHFERCWRSGVHYTTEN